MTTQNFNRATAIGATGVFLVLSLLVANYSTPKSSDPVARRPSTLFTDPSGARALLLVMRRLLPAAEQWRRPLYRLPSQGLGDASSLIVADPKIPLSKNELASLERWLSAGGQMILLSPDGWPLRGHVNADRMPVEAKDSANNQTDEESDEQIVTLLSLYVPKLRWAKPGQFSVDPASGSSLPEGEVKLRWRRSFAASDGVKTIATVRDQTLAIEIPVGQGRIVAVADPTMISNGSLRRSDNAVWLVGLVASWGDGRVRFDEYHHGFGEKQSAASLAWAFAATPWGWCLGQITAAGLLYIFGYRRRFGRVSEPPVFVRANPLDQVDARAGIFSAAKAQRLATQLMLQNLSQELSQAQGRNIDVTNLDAQAAKKLASQTVPEYLAELKSLAAKAERGENLSERELITIGRLAGMIGNAKNDRSHYKDRVKAD